MFPDCDGAGSAGVATAVPVVRVHALEIERAFDHTRENFVARQIGRETLQILQIRVGDFLFDLVPVLRAFFQIVGLVGHALDGMHARWRAGGIGNAAADDVLRRIFEVHFASGIVIGEAQRPFGAAKQLRMNRRQRAALHGICRRLGCRIV